MESKALKQSIALVADSMGMNGPIEKRIVAEEVLRQTSSEKWSIGDEREARLRFLIDQLTAYMGAPLPEGLSAQIIPSVPKEYAHAVERLPRFICISERGGVRAQHVMAWLATPEEWDSNFRLKAFVADRAAASSYAAREIRNLLMDTNVNCLADLSKHVQAAE